jgi:hypothetical protein
MKYHNIPIAVLILFAVSLLISPKIYSDAPFLPQGMSMDEFVAAVNDSNITMDSIKNELSSDGEWIKVDQDEIDSESVTDGSTEFDDDINTDYVWRPNNVPENWNPYTNGYWTYTTCGWMWVSYYSWGWRPYHYGRWWWSPRWGWVWSPGYIWGPAWVVWMFWDNYCGWYPLSPRVRWHHHHHRYYCGHLRFRVRHWVFVPRRSFVHITINNTVIVNPDKYSGILQRADFNSSIDYTNGKVINNGPSITEIEKSTGKNYEPVNVQKYNTSKKVNEYVSREEERENKEDIQKKQEAQKRQEVNTNQDTRQRYEEPRNNNETRSNNENSQKENKSTRENNTYKPENSNKQDNSYKEKPKEYEPKQNNESRQKNNDSYNSNRNNNSNRSGDNNKTATPRNEQKSNDNKSNKSNNSGNNNKSNNNSRNNDANNDNGSRNGNKNRE